MRNTRRILLSFVLVIAMALSLGSLALAADGETPSVETIESIQAYTDETMYGTGVVKVEVTYKEGVDLSGITAESYILEDRGTMTPDFGEVKIASASVKDQVVTLLISGESAATEANGLVYTGDEAQRDGPRQRNAFGIYCTNPWYRDVEGKIHFGAEDTEEYVTNETGQGYQARACLELKLRHADEEPEAALCLADELGQYTDANKWLPTIDLQFGEGGFLPLYDLQIPSTSAAAPDGSGDDYVQGFYYVPEDYNPVGGIVFTIQGQGISYWKLPDGTNNAGCGIMYDSATTSWADNGAIVVNIHDRSSSAAKFGEYDEAGYDYVIDDVNVMKYFIEKYKITGPIVIQGNSRGTMASSTIIRALAGRPYGINGNEENQGTLDKEEYPFMISAYICNNGGFRGSQEDYEAIAALGMKVWAFDGEQDSNNIENIANYKEACRTVGLSEEWIEENVRLTGYTSNIYAPWGESDHSTTRMNGWYFDDAAYYGPDLYINEQGGIEYNTKLADGDTYVLEGRGAAATNSKAGYEYRVYDDLFQIWALTDTTGELELCGITEPGYFGQKLSTLIIKYPVEIDGSKLSPEDFEVRALDNNLTGTHAVSIIDRVYTNSEPAPLAEGSVNGQYVIIETNALDKAGVVASAYYYKNAAGNTANITIMKNVAGRFFIDACQAADIEAADGTVIPASTARVMLPQENVQHKTLEEFAYVFVDDEEANEILGEFTFGNNNSPYSLSSNTRTYDHTKLTETEVLGDLNEATLAGLGVRIWYQLPENYDPNGKYPLFLYAHGTGECFTTAVAADGRVLTNDGVHFNFGMPTGAWALTETHDLDDCIVVAPQYYSGNSPRDDGYERDDAFRVALCYALKNFAVDRDRVFVSGTSQGAGRTTALVRDCADYITAAIVQNGAYSSALSRAQDVDPIEQHRMIFQFATDNDVAFWFFQGVNDFISPPLTSETMYKALVENYKAAGKSDEWIDENVRYTYLNDKIYLDMNETSFHSTMKPTYLWYAYYNDELYNACYSDAEDSLGEYFDTRYGANDPGGFTGMIQWALTRTKN